ncbi:MAG: ISAs1 family transposase [Saprospiraceae bacterium]
MKKESEKIEPLRYLISKFDECDDYRDPNRIDYTLAEILFLTFCSLVSGSESYQEISDFGYSKLEWLRKFLPFENGIPSHDTIGRVLGILNTKQLEKALVGFSKYGIELSNGAIINIDGKRISRSVTIKQQQTKKEKGGKQAVNMVNVYCSELNSCLSSIRVDSKSVEKSAIGEILDLLDLSGCTITLDAGYCYGEVTDKIVSAEADYLIGLKGNQKKLLATAKDLMSDCPAVEVHMDDESDSHGRLEQRTCKVLNFSNLDIEFKEKHKIILNKWRNIKCFIKVTSRRKIKISNKVSEETRYYISSQELMPEKANELVRKHWHVENSLHWVLDTIMGEDRGTKRAGNSAENFSILRKMAFNKLKAFDDPKVSMKRRIRKCALDHNYLGKVLQIS